MQGNLLSRRTQDRIEAYLKDPGRGRAVAADYSPMMTTMDSEMGYLDMAERDQMPENEDADVMGLHEHEETVDVLLSDMSEPWPQTDGFWKNYLSAAYFKMKTTGIRVTDHADSMVFPCILPCSYGMLW